ncbi:MAG: ATP-binding protein [Eubacteriales bacterium]|nr:ATP-binding protein [Eubacteriales bacterium]
MKQLVILSGKGGTGKTTITAAFIRLADAKAYADCDVDAPNLHLITARNTEPRRKDYYGMPKALIDTDKCVKCGMCRLYCRFSAIYGKEKLMVDTFACEGCGVCEAVCPAGAIKLQQTVSGELMLYADDNKTFSTARLKTGSGNTGLLVSEVKKQLKETAEPDTDVSFIDVSFIDVSFIDVSFIDGSPGIGCPVIATLSGADMALIVAEPTVSGISDMERIIKTARKFNIKTRVCVNKYDINIANTEKIEKFCMQEGLTFTGRIPFDKEAVKAVNRGLTVIDTECAAGKAVLHVFRKTMSILTKESDGTGEWF